MSEPPRPGRARVRRQRSRSAPPSEARIPRATYRIQFNCRFTFSDARRRLRYLNDLGVSDVYASPYLKAAPGSMHGYDVADHSQLNPEIGSQADYSAFVAGLRRYGLGQLLDVVPNHMGITEAANRWWTDVLEHGRSSPYAEYFDLTWEALNPAMRNRLLLPVLGDQYGAVLEHGDLRLDYQQGAFQLAYFERRLPIAPDSYDQILRLCIGALAAAPSAQHQHLLELQEILVAVSQLPARDERAAAMVAERQRQEALIKARLAALIPGAAEVREALDTTLRLFNGVPGEPTSFDLLDDLLNTQVYRLAYWRVAAEEINYRRFFDVNDLAALRVERLEVFRATHGLILRLLASGAVTGLRIDHPDGLWEPASYLRQLQRSYLESCSDADGDRPPPGPEPPLYVIVEKILSRNEELPDSWPVYGTTGYEFTNAVGGLLVDSANRRAFDRLYSNFIGRQIDYRDLVNSGKKMIMLVTLASEVNALASRLSRIAARHRRFRDFTLNSLTFAIREVIAGLQIYRTYVTYEGVTSERDRRAIELATAEAKRRNPRTEASIFDFIRDLLLMRYPAGQDAQAHTEQCELVLKFQQTTGPVMAKAIEDTAFYQYNRLTSLNEVGGDPEQFGTSVEEFHRQNRYRRQHWPHSLLATSTHDTKRSEDVRARIAVLSEIPREFGAALRRWARLNARYRRMVDGELAPERNDEYLLYQTLLGAWPFWSGRRPTAGEYQQFVERIQGYLVKATREAKAHTSWINPNPEYESAVESFVEQLLAPGNARFLANFGALREQVAHYGIFNSLAQSLLKLTAPGVPDIYQGSELWDFSLVDPDNRRPVDFDLRAKLLGGLRRRIARGRLIELVGELLADPSDGRIKLYVIHQTLEYRRREPERFKQGGYEPLYATGPLAEQVCAFARTWEERPLLVIAPRLLTKVVAYPALPVGRCWSENWLRLPTEAAGRAFRDIFSGQTLKTVRWEGESALPLEEVFGHFPLALLEAVDA